MLREPAVDALETFGMRTHIARSGSSAEREGMKIDNLIPENALAEALKISKSSLIGLRRRGLPFVKMAGKVFYHERLFMEWVLRNLGKSETPDDTQTD